jgi:hypothetical protein
VQSLDDADDFGRVAGGQVEPTRPDRRVVGQGVGATRDQQHRRISRRRHQQRGSLGPLDQHGGGSSAVGGDRQRAADAVQELLSGFVQA